MIKFSPILAQIYRLTESELELADAISSLRHPGGPIDVDLHLREYGGNRLLYLQGIKVAKDAPAGTGTAYMEKLCDVADKFGFYIALTIGQPDDNRDRQSRWKRTTSSDRLRRFYRRFGFKPASVSGRYDLPGTWHRKPKTL